MNLQTIHRRNEKGEIVGIYFTLSNKPSQQTYTDTYSYGYARCMYQAMGETMGLETLQSVLDQLTLENRLRLLGK